MRLSKDLKIGYLYENRHLVVSGDSLSYKNIMFSAFDGVKFRVIYLNSKDERCFLYFSVLPKKSARGDDDWTLGTCFDAVIDHIKKKGYNRFLGKNSNIVEI